MLYNHKSTQRHTIRCNDGCFAQMHQSPAIATVPETSSHKGKADSNNLQTKISHQIRGVKGLFGKVKSV